MGPGYFTIFYLVITKLKYFVPGTNKIFQIQIYAILYRAKGNRINYIYIYI